MLDLCHMLKLVRNCLGDLKILYYDSSPNPIYWSNIEALHELQQSEGIRLGNKLKSSHVQWHKQKLKVNLAAQTLSDSVANALFYCSNELKLQNFSDCSSLIKFIRSFNSFFFMYLILETYLLRVKKLL